MAISAFALSTRWTVDDSETLSSDNELDQMKSSSVVVVVQEVVIAV